ncbi:MAG: ABC transporter substrate-binding protein [Dehalococcoidia bacterium]|nr:ABC transporter substrate-binding protein [Dehalococcoidia bacterium]
MTRGKGEIMVSRLRRPGTALFLGVILMLVLALACAGGKTAAPAAPAPAPSTSPVAASAPATTPAKTVGETTGTVPVLAAELKLDPRSDEPGSTMPQEALKYHHTKMPLWTKAKYGGERVGTGGTYNILGQNPFTVFSKRNNFMGMFIMIDAGTCSSIGRTDFSVCNGVRNNNLTGVLVPGIIEKWDRPDSLTVVFTIRQGVLWPNLPPMNLRPNRNVTVEDVKWYFETQKKEGVYRDTFTLVDTFEVVDQRTLRLKFSQPHATFITMMANYGLGIIPRECYEDKDGCLSKRLISPGPFIFDEASYQPRSVAIYKKNPEFWLKGLPYLDQLRTIAVLDTNAARAAYITGQFDQFQNFSPRERDALLKQVPNSQIQTQYCSCGSAHFLLRLDKAPYNDVRVRRALSMGMDRPKAWLAANDGYNAMGMPMAFDFLGLEMFVSLKTAGPTNQYNPTEAKRLLTEAGYANGLTVPIIMATTWPTSWSSADLVTSIQEDWKKIGVTLDLKVVDPLQDAGMRRDKNWDGGLFSQCWDCSATDPDSYFLMAYSKSPRNLMGLNDPIIDDIYLKARSELDPKKREQLYWDFTNRMYDQQYGIHFGNPSGFEFFAPWLRNAASHVYAYGGVTNFSSWVMWVDPDLMKK